MTQTSQAKMVVRIFLNKYSIFTMILIFIHQAIIALSAVFLTDAIEDFQEGRDYTIGLVLYFCSMIFPYIPGYLSFVTLQRWIGKSHVEYIEALVNFLRAGAGVYRDAEMRSLVESVAARSSFMIINDVVSFVHRFTSFVLNSFLSFLVIGLILPGDIFYGYLVSLALCTVLIILTRRFIEDAAAGAELSFLKYSSALGDMWPNVSLGNRMNRQAWQRQFNTVSAVYYENKITLEIKKQFISFLLSMFSVLPTVYLLWLAVNGQASAPLIAVIIVNLTRIFHILSSLSALVSESLDWTAEWARVKVLLGVFGMSRGAAQEKGFVSDEITVNGSPMGDPGRFVDELVKKGTGRYTIRGGNGSGKSTVMLRLKKAIGESAVYLPPGEPGLYWSAEVAGTSTGQQVLQALREIVAQKDVTHLLLDEWDANLDKANIAIWSDVLERESETRVVVEVRH